MIDETSVGIVVTSDRGVDDGASTVILWTADCCDIAKVACCKVNGMLSTGIEDCCACCKMLFDAVVDVEEGD